MHPLLTILMAAALLLSGCSNKNCEKLVELACKRLEKEENASSQCERVREQSKSADDDTCGETLRLLKESGKLQK
jgi:uncharacterized lipoprotein NlpE involved in copper resistance